MRGTTIAIIMTIAIVAVALFLVLTGSASATAQETCPSGGDWVKVDGLSGHSYTYSPPEGYVVTDNCYKHATFVHYGSGDTVNTDLHWKQHCNKFFCIPVPFRPELSHASFLLEEIKATPSPSPTSTPTPSPTPTPEPTSSPSPSPTPNPCELRDVVCCEQEKDEVCETPTPTPTPEPTGTPTPPVVHSAPSTTEAPVCTDIAPVILPANPLVWRNGGTAIVQWQPTQGSHANIYYYQNENPENAHALRDVANTGYYVIEELGTLNWTFEIQQANGCAGGERVTIVDGDTNEWMLFTP